MVPFGPEYLVNDHDARNPGNSLRSNLGYNSRISSIMRWAIAQNYIDNNPASDAVAAALPRARAPRQHHLALPHEEVGAALQKVRKSDASPAAKLLFAFPP